MPLVLSTLTSGRADGTALVVARVRAEGGRRAALSLCLVLDVSGSMTGLRLELVKQAVRAIVEHSLTEADTLCLVVFAREARVLLYETQMSDNGKSAAYDALSGLQTRGGTDIGAGVRAGLALLSDARGDVRALVLLSDGEPRHGLTRPGDLADMLRDELAREAHAPVVCTMAYTTQASPAPLHALAQAGGGAMLDVPDAAKVADACAAVVGGLLGTVARDVTLTLTVGADVIPRTFRDVQEGECKHLCVLSRVGQPVAASVVYTDAATGAPEMSSAQAVAAAELCAEAEVQATRDIVVAALDTVAKLAATSVHAARARCDAALAALEACPSQDHPLMRQMIGDVREALEGLDTENAWRDGGESRLLAAHSQHASQRSNRIVDKDYQPFSDSTARTVILERAATTQEPEPKRWHVMTECEPERFIL